MLNTAQTGLAFYFSRKALKHNFSNKFADFASRDHRSCQFASD